MGAPPCAPTPLSRRQEREIWSAEAQLPPDADDGRTAVRPYTPLPPCGRGAGGEGKHAPHQILNPRKIPLNFPRIAPSPLDIRAKMCYTIDVNGANPEDPPLTNPTKMGYTMGKMESATLPLL
jgi:hypothetical protein